MALAQNPKVLLLDEPFAGLSVDERRDVQKLLAGDSARRHHRDDRARHGCRARIRRPHHAAAFRRGRRRGHARRGRRRSAHPGGLSWRVTRSASRDVDAFYGDSHVLHGVSFALGEGRLLGLLGRNGAGKTTCMNVDGRAAAAARAARSRCSASRVTRLRAGADRRARRRAGAAGPAHLQEPDRAREPGRRGAQAEPRLQARAVDARHASSPCFRACASGAARSPASLGRRAADAGDRPRADGQPARAADGRAVGRAWRRRSSPR